MKSKIDVDGLVVRFESPQGSFELPQGFGYGEEDCRAVIETFGRDVRRILETALAREVLPKYLEVEARIREIVRSANEYAAMIEQTRRQAHLEHVTQGEALST